MVKSLWFLRARDSDTEPDKEAFVIAADGEEAARKWDELFKTGGYRSKWMIPIIAVENYYISLEENKRVVKDTPLVTTL